MPLIVPIPLGSLADTLADQTERLRAREQNRFYPVGYSDPTFTPLTTSGITSPFPPLTFTAGVNGIALAFASLTALSNTGGGIDTAVIIYMTIDNDSSTTQLVGGVNFDTTFVTIPPPQPLGGMAVFFGLTENTTHTVTFFADVVQNTFSWTLTEPQMAVWPI